MWVGVGSFLGENRALHPKGLPDGVGTVSLNQKPGRGDLRPLKAPSTVATVPAGRGSIYRMGRDAVSDTSYWLSWPGTVNAVRGFVYGDTTERTYFTGNGAPKVTDNTMALTGAPYPTATRPLGIPAPVGALTAALNTAGSATTNEVRAYVYTYVSDWGEEGPPSPVSNLLTVATSATVDLTGFSVVPGGYSHINKMRIYRTETGASGATSFFFLREVSSWGTQLDDNRTLGEGIATTNFMPPPADMKGLTGMWNGMMGAIAGGVARYCEPYTPYAWPPEYETQPPDATAVALGRWGQNLLVLTTGKPVLVTGSSPESLDEQPLEIDEPCISARSVVGVGHGVVWASPDGLMYYGSAGPKNLTLGLMTRDDWQAIKPDTIVGCQYEGIYIGFYTVSGSTKGFMIDPLNPMGLYFLDTGYTAAFNDDLQDALYVLNGTNVQKWDAGAALTTVYKTKVFQMPRPLNFACAEVVSDTYPVTFKLYADGVLKHTQSVTGRGHFWLPGGYLADEYAIQLETSTNIQGCAIAESLEELKAI